MLQKSNSMGLFEKELEGLEGAGRRKVYKRLHMAMKRKEDFWKHYKVAFSTKAYQRKA